MNADRARRRCAGDVLNVIPFTIAVLIMQPSARVLAPMATLVCELRDYLKAAGACVSCEPVSVLPFAPEIESRAQGEFYRHDLQITQLDNTGTRNH